jgi:predicted RecA/RadA family phage recombinase
VASPIAPGFRVDYTPGSDVALGAVVVQGDLVGIADRPLPANKLGALAIAGIFSMPKATGTGTALTVGAKVYWDASTSKVTGTASTNVYVGKVVAAAGTSDSAVQVLLTP